MLTSERYIRVFTDGAISVVQTSASSQKDANHAAIEAILNFDADPNTVGWSPDTNDDNQWLQLDLGDYYTVVTDVATKGGNAIKNWVTKYKLQYSDDGVTFRYYREHGQWTNKVRDNSFTEWCATSLRQISNLLLTSVSFH